MFKLELGWSSTYIFENAKDAALVMDLLAKAKLVETAYVEKLRKSAYYRPETPRISLASVEPEVIYSSLHELKLALEPETLEEATK